MAANFCLPPAEVEKFKTALMSGKINPDKLSDMTSDERRAFLEKITGKENAKGVNALFESKLLLKNKQQGYITWAKKVANLSPSARRDILARIQNMDERILNPTDEQVFLKDLAAQKLGVGVTQEEAKKISDLSKTLTDTETKGLSSAEDAVKKGFTPTANDLAHGYARYDLQKYISDLKTGGDKFHLKDLKTPTGVAQGAARLPRAVADISKSIGASLDDSFALRQGMKSLITHPTYWTREFKNSFGNLVKGAKNAEEAQRAVTARIMADPVYDQAVKDGLAITKHEDVFPTSAPGRIPIVGRAFNASEIAYNAYAENLRLGLYKNELRLAEKGVKDVDPVFRKNVAHMVNSLTGRGSLGRLEPVAGPLNVAFYSLRFLKSNIDTLLAHPLGFGVGGTGDVLLRKEGAKLAGSYAQKRAAQNLVKVLGATAGILAVADKLKPGSVEWDPRSSNFGKIKIGDTRFDVSGGSSTLITLAARLAKQSTKSSSGVITKYNSGQYGAPTELDAVVDFLRSKASPVGGVVTDKLAGSDVSGNKTTAKGELGKLGTPLNVNNYVELEKDKNSANIFASVLADELGISTNTYGKSNVNWENKPTTETKAFQKTVSSKQFKQANDLYNQKLDAALKKTTSNPTFKTMPDDQKNATLTAIKTKIQKEVFKQYNFTYKKAKPNQQSNKAKKSLVNAI